MRAHLTPAKIDDLTRILPMVEAFHAEMGIRLPEADRIKAIKLLLNDDIFGGVYLVGPTKSPIGYVVISHSYSIRRGGKEAFIDELYLRPSIRGRGLGREVIDAIAKLLTDMGTRTLHVDLPDTNSRAVDLYNQKDFVERDKNLMTRSLNS